jgi:hypothetical protein
MAEHRPGARGVVSRVHLVALPEAMPPQLARHECVGSPSLTRHASVVTRFVAEQKTLLEAFVKTLLKTFLKYFVTMVVESFVEAFVKTQMSKFVKTQALYTRKPAGTRQQEALARRELDRR